MSSVTVPEVRKFGTFDVEPFQTYLERWPKELSNFPTCVIENWVYRHWSDFRDLWLRFDLRAFQFEAARFSNPQVMAIGHFDDWFKTLDYWGDDLFKDKLRRSSWLGAYMLKNGTVPTPIIVAMNAGEIEHPRGGFLKTPTHLIEGHMRLAYLRGLIRHCHSTLKNSHAVWLLDFQRPPRKRVH
jgi:hypothetical protein